MENAQGVYGNLNFSARGKASLLHLALRYGSRERSKEIGHFPTILSKDPEVRLCSMVSEKFLLMLG
jgi:hypothetical protein